MAVAGDSCSDDYFWVVAIDRNAYVISICISSDICIFHKEHSHTHTCISRFWCIGIKGPLSTLSNTHAICIFLPLCTLFKYKYQTVPTCENKFMKYSTYLKIPAVTEFFSLRFYLNFYFFMFWSHFIWFANEMRYQCKQFTIDLSSSDYLFG